MGKFINTSHTDIINNLSNEFNNKLKNPYYLFMDAHATITTYYSQDLLLSTLDEGSKLQYSASGIDSPVKYNKIENFYLFGLDKVIVDLQEGEWGLESSTIEGEVKFLPNTIKPIPNDYFIINYLNQDLAFKIYDVTIDTIDNGANIYKANYKLDKLNSSSIEDCVSFTYNMIINNLSENNYNIIKKEQYESILSNDSINNTLKEYYKDLFYKEEVQTFILNYNGNYFYDPYLIEFIIRFNLVDSGKYLFVNHQIEPPNTFSIDYDKSFFRLFELKNIKKLDKYRYSSQAYYINDLNSIMYNRLEDYFRIEYNYINNPCNNTIQNFNLELLEKIKTNSLYIEPSLMYRNIIIKYLNNKKITRKDLENLEDIEFAHDINLFYELILIIFIIDINMKNIIE